MSKYKVIFSKEYIVEANNQEEALDEARNFWRYINSRMADYKIEELNNE